MRASLTRKFRGTLQDIRLFVAAYEEETFTGAASRENTVQSAVSQHIRSLEELHDVKLFLREKSRVVPTPAADGFYRQCVEVLRGLNEAAAELSSLSKSLVGEVRIGSIPAINRRIFAPALLRFQEKHPNVNIKVIEAVSTQFPEILKSGGIDFALASALVPTKSVLATSIIKFSDCLMARADPGNPSAVMTKLPDTAIKICWASGGLARRDAIVAGLAAMGVKIAQEIVLDSAFAVLDLAGRSDWHCLAPPILIDPEFDAMRFAIRPIRHSDTQFEIAVLERKTEQLSAPAQAFLDELISEMKGADARWAERFAAAGI